MKKTLVAIAASCMLSAAFAQTAAPSPASTPGSNAVSAPGATKREARVEERVAQLHASLKITSQQEDQWGKFANVMRDNARTVGDLYRQRVAQRDTMSALDDMKQYEQITQANADGTKRLVEAFEPLYASFSPEQKKLADTSFRQESHDRAQHARARHPSHAAATQPASTTKP